MASPVRAVEPPNVPDITVGTDLERIINEGIAALAKDSRVFQRGGQLVGVVTVPDGPARQREAISRAAGSPVIRSLQHATVRERLSASARWVKHDGRSKQYKQVLPPETAVSGVIARGEWGGVRPLISVITSPCLKPDGTVLQDPGYDADTATLYWPRESYIRVPEHPSQEDAIGALEALREVVCDFPFARLEHEAAWLAGVLTMLARPAIAGPCPLFGVDATTRGTGKSRLVDAAVRLVTGMDAARTSLPDDDDEMRKRITSLMVEGDVAVCLDNITRSVTLPSLDNLLTATTWKDRVLGSTGTVSAPARAVWWATGNNLVLGGDLSRRTLHIRLESLLENPEERTGFKHADLLHWIGENRRKLVACALTILRAYTCSGQTIDCGLWGSYEDWSRIVPPALAYAGMTNPLVARATIEPAMDDEKMALASLIDGLRRLCPIVDEVRGVQPISAKAILAALYPERDAYGSPAPPDGFDSLRDTIEAQTNTPSGRKPDGKRLGKWLQKVRGRVIDGWLIQRHSGPNHTATWRAQPATAG